MSRLDDLGEILGGFEGRNEEFTDDEIDEAVCAVRRGVKLYGVIFLGGGYKKLLSGVANVYYAIRKIYVSYRQQQELDNFCSDFADVLKSEDKNVTDFVCKYAENLRKAKK